MILAGDSLAILATLDDNSVDAVVTDPPYGLKFMGKKWDYDVPGIEYWEGVIRALKPGGYLLAFGGTRTYHRLTCAIEDAGFEIRDQIQWIYGSGFPKSHNIGNGFGTALKPANEPIVLARKTLSESTVAKNVLKHGTGALNIDGSRIAGDKPQTIQGGRSIKGNAFNGNTEGEVRKVLSDNSQGRWPANVIFDEDAAAMLDEQSLAGGMHGAGKARTGITGNGKGLFGLGGGNTPRVGDSGGASRFFYCAKASKRERNAGLEGMPERSSSKLDGGAYVRSGGIAHEGLDSTQIKSANHHPTVKPIKLMEYLCRLITPLGGTILDPFWGSGSTGVAAKRLGYTFIGIEREESYVEIARKRLESVEITEDDGQEPNQLEMTI